VDGDEKEHTTLTKKPQKTLQTRKKKGFRETPHKGPLQQKKSSHADGREEIKAGGGIEKRKKKTARNNNPPFDAQELKRDWEWRGKNKEAQGGQQTCRAPKPRGKVRIRR